MFRKRAWQPESWAVLAQDQVNGRNMPSVRKGDRPPQRRVAAHPLPQMTGRKAGRGSVRSDQQEERVLATLRIGAASGRSGPDKQAGRGRGLGRAALA